MPNPPTHPRPTIRDVARRAGVAPATVSAILNQRKHCFASDQTRRHVTEAARILGYRPNPAARALNGKSTATIGIVIANLVTEMANRKLAGFVEAARQKGFVTLTACHNANQQRVDDSVRRLVDQAVDGIVFYPPDQTDYHEVRQIVDAGYPVVTFDAGDRLGFETWDVSVDAYAAGRTQIRHLIDLGRRRIVIVDRAERCWVNDRKVAGMTDALRDAGLQPLRLSIGFGDRDESCFTRPHVVDAIRQFLADHRGDVDGVATIGDWFGLDVLRAAAQLGIAVPDSIAVVSQDGLYAAERSAMPLSTVSHDPVRIGALAFELLKQQIDGAPARPARRELIKPVLHARASTLGINAPEQLETGNGDYDL